MANVYGFRITYRYATFDSLVGVCNHLIDFFLFLSLLVLFTAKLTPTEPFCFNVQFPASGCQRLSHRGRCRTKGPMG